MTLPWMVLVLTLWTVVLGLAVIVLGLLRRIAPVLEAAERTLRTTPTTPGDLGGLGPGAPVPDFRLTTLPERRERRFSDLIGRGVVVLFVQESCPACETLLAQLDPDPAPVGGAPLLVVTAREGHAAELADHGKDRGEAGIRLAVQRDAEASRAFAQMAYPQAFAVDASATVAAQLIPSSIADLERLGRRVSELPQAPQGVLARPSSKGGSS